MIPCSYTQHSVLCERTEFGSQSPDESFLNCSMELHATKHFAKT